MFGPNTVGNYSIYTDSSHRGSWFQESFREAQRLFQNVFGLEKYLIMFVPGTGTSGLEALIRAWPFRLCVTGPWGRFTDRLQELVYLDEGTRLNKESFELFCQFETSANEFHDTTSPCVVDAISSFPYKPLPDSCVAFVTCLNKQLGLMAGISIVGVRLDYMPCLRQAGHSLDLREYSRTACRQSVPFTFPSYILLPFIERLRDPMLVLDLRDQIAAVSKKVVEAVGEKNIIGALRSPAIAVEEEAISPLVAKEFELYKGAGCYHIFTYSHPIEQYQSFLEALHVRS